LAFEHSDAPTDSPYRSIALGTGFACAIDVDTDGIACWGNGAPTVGASGYQEIVAAGTGLCALTLAGGVECWDNRHGSLRDWPFARIPTGTGYSLLAIGLDQISTDWEAACALHDSGEIHCWSMFNSYQSTVTQIPTQFRYR
jgi:hypothetical protein